MYASDINNIIEKYGESVDGVKNVSGQIIMAGGQSFSGPFSWVDNTTDDNATTLRMRIVVLPQGIDPSSPEASQHARLNDLYIEASQVVAILVPAKVSSLTDPSGRKIVLG